MATYRIGGEVRIRGTFEMEFADDDEMNEYVDRLEGDDDELLSHLIEAAYTASDGELEDIAAQNADGKWRDIYF